MVALRREDPDPAQEGRAAYAARALRAYVAMQGAFRTRSGLYRRGGAWRLPGAIAHVWPFARAMIATLDLAGIDPELTTGFEAEVAIADRLAALERYWDPHREPPAYSSDPVGSRLGGDRYYDDNAWVGLALIQLERLRPGRAPLERAEAIYRFAVAGWDDRPDASSPGGVFWIEQGSGAGARNHDRNTVSSVPNAQLGLHLAELTGGSVPALGSAVTPEDMYGWVLANLDAGDLFWDKIRGDGSIDRALWSYNQGSMVGASVLLARRGGTAVEGGAGTKAGDGGEGGNAYLARAEVIARRALAHYSDGELERQPPSFNAIFFRNLLLLHHATSDARLRQEIMATMRGYADWAWEERRDRADRIRISDQDRLLDQSALVQILALLAWEPGSYGRIA